MIKFLLCVVVALGSLSAHAQVKAFEKRDLCLHLKIYAWLGR